MCSGHLPYNGPVGSFLGDGPVRHHGRDDGLDVPEDTFVLRGRWRLEHCASGFPASFESESRLWVGGRSDGRNTGAGVGRRCS